MMLSAYDPADPTISISPAGFRFKWQGDYPYLIRDDGQLEIVYPPVQLESGYAESYLWDQAQASIIPETWNFVPYAGGGWVTPILTQDIEGEGAPTYRAGDPSPVPIPLFESGFVSNLHYGNVVANFGGTAMYSPAEIRAFAVDHGWVRPDGALVSEAAAWNIYGAAKVYGITAAQIDLAMGWPAGTAQGWIVANGQQPLTGVPMNMATPGATPAPAPAPVGPSPVYVAPPPGPSPTPAPAPSPNGPPVLVLPAGNPTPGTAPAPMGGAALILAALAALSALS